MNVLIIETNIYLERDAVLWPELQEGNSHKGLNKGQYIFPNNAAQIQ